MHIVCANLSVSDQFVPQCASISRYPVIKGCRNFTSLCLLTHTSPCLHPFLVYTSAYTEHIFVIAPLHCLHTLTLSVRPTTSLKPLDVEFMKRLHNYVNIVPVIAKADTLTLEERDAFKQRVSSHSLGKVASWYGGFMEVLRTQCCLLVRTYVS